MTPFFHGPEGPPVPRWVRQATSYATPLGINQLVGDTLLTDAFIDRFVVASGNHSIKAYRAIARRFRLWLGSDSAVAVANADILVAFEWREGPADYKGTDLKAVRASRSKRVIKAQIAARLVLFLQYQQLADGSGWDDDLSICAAYRDALIAAGYGGRSVRHFVLDLYHLIVWCRLNHIAPNALTDDRIEPFMVHRCRCGVIPPNMFGGVRCEHNRRLAFVRLRRILAGSDPLLVESRIARTTRRPPQPLPPSAEAFLTHLETVQGLGDSSLVKYRRSLAHWTAELGADSRTYDARGIRAAYRKLLMTGQCHQELKTAITGYLRYLSVVGTCSPTLPDALVPHGRSPKRLPRTIARAELQRIVEKTDRSTPIGLRNYALLTMLNELGLRGGEVIKLQLQDLDFEQGRIAISGKGGRAATVPMTAQVGEALIAYIEQGRPRTDEPALFIRARPPHVRLYPTALSSLVKTVLEREGHKGGSHVFRRALATSLLNDGASLQDVATVLRHENLETTLAYVRVSEAILRTVAQPWGGAQ